MCRVGNDGGNRRVPVDQSLVGCDFFRAARALGVIAASVGEAEVRRNLIVWLERQRENTSLATGAPELIVFVGGFYSFKFPSA